MAVMFERDCGATTAFTTQVSIVRSDEQPTGTANTFIADDGHGAAPAGAWGGPRVAMTWLGPDHLVIRYAARSRVYKKAADTSGVKVSYEETTF